MKISKVLIYLIFFEKSRNGFNLYVFFDQSVSILSSFFTLAGYLAILFTFNWLMLFVVIAAVTINIFVNRKKNKNQYKMSEKAAPINRKLGYFASLINDITYAKEIKVNNIGSFIINKYNKQVNEFKNLLTNIYRRILKYIME